MPKVTIYECQYCGAHHKTEDNEKLCEASHLVPIEFVAVYHAGAKSGKFASPPDEIEATFLGGKKETHFIRDEF